MTSQERHDFFEGSSDARRARASKPEGDTPEKSAKPKTVAVADSAPAKPVEQVASTDAKPETASEPVTPAKETKGLDARSADVDLKIADLKRKLEIKQELERQLATRPEAAKPTDAAPVTAKKAWEAYKDLPDAPKSTDFESYEDYLDARSDFIAEQKYKSLRADEQKVYDADRQRRDFETRTQASIERGTKFWETHPDLKAEVNPLLLEIIPTRVYAQIPPDQRTAGDKPHPLGDLLWESPVAAEVTVYLSRNPDQLQALLSSPDAATLLRRFGGVEARVEKLFEPEGQPVRVAQPKTVPDADELPVTLGKKAPITAEASTTTAGFGDFATYERQWKRERGFKD